MLAACHIVHVMGLDFLLLVLPCAGFLYRFISAYIGEIKSEFESNARCNNESHIIIN